MVHLRVQHPFGQSFLEIVKQAIRIESRLGVGAGQQLIEKGIRNARFFASRHGRPPLLPSCPTPHEIPYSPSSSRSASSSSVQINVDSQCLRLLHERLQDLV